MLCTLLEGGGGEGVRGRGGALSVVF
jgi:hypothetical protein